MRTQEELKRFYQTDLLADLKILELKRKKVLKKYISVGVVILCVLGVSSFFVIANSFTEPLIVIVPVVISMERMDL